MQLELPMSGGCPAVSVSIRRGGGTLLLLLHGIGCGKDSFAGAFTSGHLTDYSLCAFDFPGHGGSSAPRSTDDLLGCYADVTVRVADWARAEVPGIERVFIVGHSMGGAVGVLAASGRSCFDGFVDVDGNLIAEDCGLASREMAEQPAAEFLAAGYRQFLGDLRRSGKPDLQAWAEWYKAVDPATLHQAARSLVEWSDSGKLLESFLRLPRRAYMYGAADDKSYLLDRLAGTGTVKVPDAGHFMMVDNPAVFYKTVSMVIGRWTAQPE
jgi:pimeloyl-ACP methyl ester carboxylesterase